MMTDYPKLSVWPDGYYLSYAQIWNGNYEGPAACVFDRNSMLSGSAATMQCFLKTGSSNGFMLPGDWDGTTPPPAGSPAYFLNFDGNEQSLDLWQFHVDWANPANSTFTGPTNIPVAPFTEACGETVVEFNYTTGNCIPQAGTTVTLDSYGDRLMYRLAYRNFGDHQSLVANHTVATGTSGSQTGIRWYELQNTGSGFGLFQQGTYAPDSNYRWQGSIAMDKAGDIVLGYNVSSATMSPSIRYTARVPSDPLGQMENEVDILSAVGITPNSRTNNFRWADYSSLAIDPTDDCTFWHTTEYMPASTTIYWGTRIASFSFPSCTQTSSLTVIEVGQGTVTSTDGTINCTNRSGTCNAPYANGTAVTMNATAASGWTFSGWSGACTGSNPCSVVMNSNLNATATFLQNFTLTVTEVGQGTVASTDGLINCTNGTGTCSAVYTSGTSVTLNATPRSGFAFSGWSGACTGGNPCNLVMNSKLTATASFVTSLPNYTLTVSETGRGTVTSTDGAINCTNGSGTCSAVYVSGTSVTLNATPATGQTFMGWSAPCSGRSSCSVVMNSNLTAPATFVTTPAWAMVHKTSKAGAITSITIPATGSGHLIAVALMFNGGTSVTSISDNVGNSYVSAGARTGSGANSVEIWYAQNSIAGATLIAPSFVRQPTSLEIATWEVSGVLSLPPDATNTVVGTVTLNNTPGAPVTTTQAGDFMVSVLFALNTIFTSISTGNEFTNDFTNFGNGWAHITSNASSAGTHQASWFTSSPTGTYCSSTVAFAP
jgi:hypothetical protein